LNTLLAALALATVSLVGSRIAFPARRSTVGLRTFLSAGSHFIVFGFLLGPQVTGLLTPEVLRIFSPFIALGLGWIGLLIGLQFDVETLRTFERRELRAAFGQAAVTFVVLALGGWLILELARPGAISLLPFVLAAAAAGCVSSPTGAAIVFGSTRVQGPESRLATLMNSLDAGVGLFALAAVFAAFHPPVPAALLDIGPFRWLVIPILLSLVFGWIFYSLTRDRGASEEFILFLLGIALILAGSNLILGTSALFAAALTGAVIANVTPIRRRTYPVLVAWEKPVHVLFLLLAGSLLRLSDWRILPLLAGFLALRFAGKMLGGVWAGGALPSRTAGSPPASGFGLTLMSQGGVSIAIAVSALLTFRGTLALPWAAALMFDVVVLGTMMYELAGPAMLGRRLDAAGEMRPDPQPGPVPAAAAG
jgi:hypothetical protein